MSTFKNVRRGSIAVGLVVVAAAATHTAIGSADPAKQLTRTEALLATTQAELADTQHRVSEIQLEHTVDGREVYALSGPNTRCILVARHDQEAGHSESLACSVGTSTDEQRPFATGFRSASGSGYVDLVWPTGGMPSQVATGGVPIDVRLGSQILVAHRTDDSNQAELSWNSTKAGRIALQLPSRAERDAQRQPAS